MQLRARRVGGHYFRFLTESSGIQLEHVGRVVDVGKVRTVVERIYPFDQAVEALQYAATGRARGNSSFSYRHERQEDEGQDITGVPLLRRRELLKKVLAENEVIRF